jgi:hypothetical protein
MRRPSDKRRTIIKTIWILCWPRFDGFFKRLFSLPFCENSFFEFGELRFSFWEWEHKKTIKKHTKK